MALVNVNFISNALKRTVSINVILPVDKLSFIGYDQEIHEYKTLYLLHGLLGNNTDYITKTRIQEWAEARNLVVVMPSGDNSFYVDGVLPNYEYGKFIGEELVDITRKMFHLSTKREDTFIAGLSMGGFGALRNGLKYSETFGYIATMSAALNMFEQDPNDPARCLMHEDAVLGDLEEARLSDKNPRICMGLCTNKPKIFMCCGKQDGLITYNHQFFDALKEAGFDVTFKESDGIHNWDFWNEYLPQILDWLPLDDKQEGIHSGNVQKAK